MAEAELLTELEIREIDSDITQAGDEALLDSDWYHRSRRQEEITLYLLFVDRILIFLASCIVLIYLVCCRKRPDFIYWSVPLCFLLSGALGMYVGINDVRTFDSGENTFADIAIILAAHYMLYTTGHQFFASQYLKTSLTLPIFFEQAEVEQYEKKWVT